MTAASVFSIVGCAHGAPTGVQPLVRRRRTLRTRKPERAVASRRKGGSRRETMVFPLCRLPAERLPEAAEGREAHGGKPWFPSVSFTGRAKRLRRFARS